MFCFSLYTHLHRKFFFSTSGLGFCFLCSFWYVYEYSLTLISHELMQVQDIGLNWFVHEFTLILFGLENHDS
jgi:hypothetical protein